MYTDIIQLLDQRRLKEALIQLNAFAADMENNWQLLSDIERLQTTYGYLLQYAAQGIDDPERGKLYARLRRTAYELADRANFLQETGKGHGHFAEKCRNLRQVPPHTFQELLLGLEAFSEDAGMVQLTIGDETRRNDRLKDIRLRHEKAVDELFDKIWTSTHWTEEEYAAAGSIPTSLIAPANDIAVMISAVTLSLLKLFDSRKFLFLIETYQARREPVISQRALIGIALAAYYQRERLSLYPDLLASLTLLNDMGTAADELETIQTLFLLSRETEKIDKKMREEIIPKIMHNQKLMNPDLKITDIEDLEDKNPEWSKEIDSMQEKLREVGELQMEGADTYMSTFAQLKSYPFFRQAAHWFYPFDKQVNEIAQTLEPFQTQEQSFIGLLVDSPMFCNSDKYSFCLTLNRIPRQQREQLGMQLSGAGEAFKESGGKHAAFSKENEKPGTVSRQYIHDLYRFFKLWMYRNEQHDIFTDRFNLWDCHALSPFLHTPDKLRHIANHLFSKDYMEEASRLYQELSELQPDQAEVWQKLGFALQKLKQYPEAIKAYQQADLLKPEHVWTLKHLAQCFKRMHEYPRALEYFYKVEDMQPDNLGLLLQIGQCLATLRMYDKALAYFFKVEYLDKTPANAQRAIGWCYFMTGKYDDATRFYDKLLEMETVQTADWLNAGHVHLAAGHMPQALECYRKAEKSCSSHDEFLKLFLNDKQALTERGIPDEEIYLVPDMM